MRYIASFFRFWYDFLIGDDWRIAAAVVVTLLLAAAVAHWLSARAAAIVIVAGVLITAGDALRRSVADSH